MAFYDIARSKSAYDSYVVLRGTFASTAAGVWATRYVKTTTGLLDGRMEIEAVENSLSDVAGGAPERVNVTVRLHDHDSALAKYTRGTASTAAASEYLGDGWINFTGQLFLGVRDPATGSLYEQAISPTLCLSGPPAYDGFTVTLPLGSYDDRILGQSQIAFTVRDLKNSTAGSAGDGAWYGRWLDGAMTQADFTATLTKFTDNLDETVPYLYGKNVVPLLKVGESIASDKASIGSYTYLGWATVKEPVVTQFAYNGLGGGSERWPFFVGSMGDPLIEVGRNSRPEAGSIHSVLLETVQRSITNAQGDTFEVWVAIIKIAFGNDEQGHKSASGKLFVDVGEVQGVEDPLTLWTLTYGYAAALIRSIVRDHSIEGASGVDATSFERAKGGNGCGLLYKPTDTVRSAIGKIAAAAGMTLWIGVDDTLHIAALGSFSKTDTAAIAAGLTHITAADILGDWKEELPFVAQQLGAPARRVLLRWNSDQEQFWKNDAKGNTLLVEAPGVLLSFPDIFEAIDAEIPGDAIYPPRALDLLTAAATRRGKPRRRITATCRAWLATMEKGSLLWLSHPRGLGDNSGGGYSMRVVRLESTQYTWAEDGCQCRFEDLGPLSDLRLGVLDGITHWVKATPTAGWTLTLTSGSPTATSNNNIFTAGMVGCNLWTPGAANAGNRSSKKIAAFIDAKNVTLESNSTTNEVIVAAGSDYTATWIIMDTQGTKGTAYRPTKIRHCVEATGLYRDGATTGFSFSVN